MTTTISDKETHSSNGYNYSTPNDQLVITSTGALIGQQGLGIENFGYNNSIDNSGYIFGGNYGIELDGTGDTVTNEKSGVISGSNAGIFTFGGNTIVNHGTITGQDGVDIEGNTAGSLTNDGTISGSVGVLVNAMAGVTISNGGTLIGWQYGIHVETGASIHNTGTIDGDVLFDAGTNVFDGIGGTINGSITGGSGNDTFDLSHQTVSGTISGGGGNDIIQGTTGNDVMDGGAGTNTVIYASATAGVTVNLASTSGQNTGAAGIDTLSNFGNLTGSAYADKLFGSAAANVISGGAGNDIITGGAGGDVLSGGAGGDRFIYNAATDSPTSGPDLITDFTTGSDKIDLTGLHLVSNSEVTFSNNGSYTLVGVDTDNNGAADMIIKVAGINAVKLSDVLTGVTPAAVPAHPVTPAHHDLVETLHAVAVDHGLYG